MRPTGGREALRSGALPWLLGIFAFIAVVFAPFIGAVPIPFGSFLGGTLEVTAAQVLWEIRVPRVCIAFITGGALALGGFVFQTLFRNVLATPYTLGVSSGAALGAAVYFQMGVVFSVGGVSGSAVAALGGALLIVVAIDRIAARHVTTTTLLLAGVVLTLFSGSAIALLEYMSGPSGVFQLSRWLMGGLDSISVGSVLPLLPLVAVGMGIAVFKSADLNLLALGDELAMSRGVDAPRVRRGLLVGVSIMIGAVVSFAGPIGFVGMLVPQTLRMLIGGDSRRLVPATALGGGVFLVVCDTVARTLVAPLEIPVGIVTALIGGPYFLYLLLRSTAPVSARE
jgi:iron complex transport system permease protein